MLKPQLFLDCNAHLPTSQPSIDRFLELNQSLAGHGHPSALAAPGRAAAKALEEVRVKIAQLIGAKRPSQIVITNTCSEACEWAVKILVKRYPEQIFQLSPFEHTAVRDPVFKYLGTGTPIMATNSKGYLEIKDTHSIVVHAQNEFGNIYPVMGIDLADMSQSLGKIPVDVTAMDVSMAVFAGHKVGGFNIGWLYLKDETWWTEFGTGSRYMMDRPGTPRVLETAATAVAVEEALRSLPERTANCLEFKKILEPGLQELGYQIVGGEDRLPGTTFVFKEGAIMDLIRLGDAGIHVGLGSACGSVSTGSSPSIRALGYQTNNQNFLRISNWGYGSKEAKQVLEALR